MPTNLVRQFDGIAILKTICIVRWICFNLLKEGLEVAYWVRYLTAFECLAMGVK